MSETLDILLVIAAVLAATGYLIWRKIRAARRISRDWVSGRGESCGSCPVIEIRKAQRSKSTQSR